MGGGLTPLTRLVRVRKANSSLSPTADRSLSAITQGKDPGSETHSCSCIAVLSEEHGLMVRGMITAEITDRHGDSDAIEALARAKLRHLGCTELLTDVVATPER